MKLKGLSPVPNTNRKVNEQKQRQEHRTRVPLNTRYAGVTINNAQRTINMQHLSGYMHTINKTCINCAFINCRIYTVILQT